MKKKILHVAAVAAMTLACSSGTDGPSDSGTGGKTTATGGAMTSTGGAGTGGATGGASTGGSSTGGAATGGASTGGSSTGGAATGGSSNGGASNTGGKAAGGTTTGGQGGGQAGGSSGGDSPAAALNGLRVEDPCTPNPPTTSMATCQHLMLTAGGFKGTKSATMGGTTGTTYDVTLHVRGIAEITQIDGGMRTDNTTFTYMGSTYRKVPFTIGGTVNRGDYQVWEITVSNPKQTFTLNDYGKVGHYVFKLDYEATIPVAAGATVTLEGVDTNDHLIVNYDKVTVDGVPTVANWGQFVQLDVVSAKAR